MGSVLKLYLTFLKLQKPEDMILILVSYLPYQGEGMEPKTKPTQYAIRTLNSAGLQPDFVLARAIFPLDEKRKEKISFNCGVPKENIISAPDEKIIYKISLNFEKEKIGKKILKALGLKEKNKVLKNGFTTWKQAIEKIECLKKEIKIGIVGKYFKIGDFILADAYISVIEVIKHASWQLGYKPKIDWLNSEEYEKDKNKLEELKNYNRIIIPRGFGSRGVERKILAIQFCRENKIPIFGLCYGLQLMVVEFARNVCGLRGAYTTEVNPKTKYPVIDVLKEQKKFLKEKLYGGTMRLVDWRCEIKRGTIAYRAYKKNLIFERHRYRYEVNPKFHKILQKNGLVFFRHFRKKVFS